MAGLASNVPPVANHFINADGRKIAFVFQVPKTGTLDLVEFRTGTVGGPPSIRVSFQDIDPATGSPDGTQDQYRDITVSTDAWHVPGVMTSDGTDGGTKRSVTVGDWLGVVFEFASFTAGHFLNLSYFQTYSVASQGAFVDGSWTATFNGTTWSKFVSAPILALKYSDGTYAPISSWTYPINTISTVAINTSTTPDEIGLRFQFPFACQVSGAWMRGDLGNVADLILYDAADNVLASFSHDPDIRVAGGGINKFWRFAPVDLSANTTYRLILKPTSTSSVSLYTMNLANANHLQAIDGGTEWYYTSRSDAGAWTDTNTRRPFMGLQVSGVDTAGGGGGGAFAYAFMG